MVAMLVEHLASGTDELESIHALRALQEKGFDISRAFAALGRSASRQSWALELLKRAAESGTDIEAAVNALQAIVKDGEEHQTVGDYPAWAAAEVLARHFARTAAYARLEPLVRSPKPSIVESALKAVRWAVLSGKAGIEALLFLGRMERGASPAVPGRTSWRKDRDNVEVNDKEVLAWTDGGHDGIGASYPLEGFLDDTVRLVGFFDTFGPEVLLEIVEAVEARGVRRRPSP